MKDMFYNAVDYCKDAYDVPLLYDEDGERGGNVIGFHCPNCGEPIYEADWTDKDTENWLCCPICEAYFGGED